MIKGLDYSVGRPPAEAVRKAGHRFVVRYLAYPGARPKYITKAEADDMIGHSIAVALVWETTDGRALSGHAAGATDARIAARSARDVGQPTDRPIYFAVDVDITSSAQMAAVDAYLDGAASVLGRGRIGVYGEYDVIEHCLAGGSAKWGWQTRAWSKGKTSTRAHLLQEIGERIVGGVACDQNVALQTDFGQWPAPGPAAKPKAEDDVAAPDVWNYSIPVGPFEKDIPHAKKSYTAHEYLTGANYWANKTYRELTALRVTIDTLAGLVARGSGLNEATIKAAVREAIDEAVVHVDVNVAGRPESTS